MEYFVNLKSNLGELIYYYFCIAVKAQAEFPNFQLLKYLRFWKVRSQDKITCNQECGLISNKF